MSFVEVFVQISIRWTTTYINICLKLCKYNISVVDSLSVTAQQAQTFRHTIRNVAVNVG